MKLLQGIWITYFLLVGLQGWAQHENTYTGIMVERLENAKKYSLDLANAMPDERYTFKPAETEMTFGKQLQHMAQNLEMICTRYLGAELPEYELNLPNQDKALVLPRLAKAFDFAISAVKNLTPDQLDDEVDFFAGKKIKMQMVNLLNDHQAHHRGQLIVYLRLNGITPPPYIGW